MLPSVNQLTFTRAVIIIVVVAVSWFIVRMILALPTLWREIRKERSKRIGRSSARMRRKAR